MYIVFLFAFLPRAPWTMQLPPPCAIKLCAVLLAHIRAYGRHICPSMFFIEKICPSIGLGARRPFASLMSVVPVGAVFHVEKESPVLEEQESQVMEEEQATPV
jgi:hypothetical protein